ALAPTILMVQGRVRHLVVERCVMGPIIVLTPGNVETLTVNDTIVQAIDDSAAFYARFGSVELTRSTVLGQLHAHQIKADTCIFAHYVNVVDRQSGCVRFSAYPQGSTVPKATESQFIRADGSMFTSRRFGDPGYAQLLATADEQLRAGSEDGG